MTDYTQATDFSAKDALTQGDANKVIYGAHIDAEFDLIATAIGTKYDSADLASQSVAEAGTDNTVLMTPLRAAQWYAAVSDSVVKAKSANETISNSTTLQDDDHLASFTIAASGVYKVTGILYFTLKAGSDVKFCLTLASDPTSMAISFHLASSTLTVTSQGNQTVNATAVSATYGSDGTLVVSIDGVVINDTDATTMKLQWAQDTAVVENTVLNAGSYIELTRIS